MTQVLDLLTRCGAIVYRTIVRMNGSSTRVATTRVAWRSRLARWSLAFLALCLAYQVYAIAIVPLVEPPVTFKNLQHGHADAPSRSASHPELAELFPAGAWQRKDPMVLETDGGMLLFQDYKTDSDGRLVLSPCTAIFFAPTGGTQVDEQSDPKTGPPASNRRPIILEAPDRAVLNFAGPLNLGRAKISRLRGARLEGEITISSPPSRPGANDQMLIVTRNVQILPNQIWTPHDVEFRYGPHRGSGRDLSIMLETAEEGDDSKPTNSPIASVKSLELVHIDKLTFYLPDSRLFDPKPDASSKESLSVAGGSPKAAENPVEITCAGPFHFNFQEGVASFEDHVDVIRVHSSGLEDQLSCQQLLIYFNMSDRPGMDRETAEKRNRTDQSDAISLKPQRIVAVGLPVVLRAPSVATLAHGQRLEYDFTTRRIQLKDDHKAEFTYRQHRVESPKLEYEIHEQPRRLGRLWADGPGIYRGRSDQGDPQTIEVAWQGELRLQPQDGLHVLSVVDGAHITFDKPMQSSATPASVSPETAGHFSAKKLFLWLAESPAESADDRLHRRRQSPSLQLSPNRSVLPTRQAAYSVDRPKQLDLTGPGQVGPGQVGKQEQQGEADDTERQPELRLVKMLAVGKVDVDFPQLIGEAEQLKVWFDHPPAQHTANLAGAQDDAAQTRSVERSPSSAIGNRPVVENRSQPSNGSLLKMPNSNGQLELHGELVRLRVTMSKTHPTIREATVTGNVRLTKNAAVGGSQSLVVTGQTLQLRTDPLERISVDINGVPARVFAQGMLLEGAALHFSQRENRMWADGPGRMMLPSKSRQSAPSKPGTPIWVNWKGGMDFNGQLVRFLREVEIRGVHSLENGDNLHLLAKGEQLHAKMNRFVDFRRSKQPAGLDVAEVRFLGEVEVENQTFTPNGTITSHDQFKKIRDFVLDRSTGKFEALGPGWITSRRIDDGRLQQSLGGSTNSRTQVGNVQQLMFLRVDFKNKVVGNVDRREVEFGDYVQTVYGPIQSWDETLDPGAPGGVGPEGMSMTCQRMTIAQMGQAGMQSVELKAVGNAFVQGAEFSARGDRLSYSAMKDQLVLEGIGRSFAVLEQHNRTGQRPSTSTARKIIYFPRSGQIDVKDVRSIDYNHYGAPTARSRHPQTPIGLSR